jgi:hypothetical protein
MVRVEVAVPEPGVMIAGEKEQLKVLGTPVHDSEMGLFEAPDCAFAVTVRLPDFPAGIVTAVGEAPKDMTVGGGGPDGGTVAGQVGL